MHQRMLVIRRDFRGCTLFDGARPLAWYPTVSAALDLAYALAEASALRDEPPARVEVRDARHGLRRNPLPARPAPSGAAKPAHPCGVDAPPRC